MVAAAVGVTLLNNGPHVPSWLQTCDVTVCTLQLAAMLLGAARPSALGGAGL
jgi:hypothetical protein